MQAFGGARRLARLIGQVRHAELLALQGRFREQLACAFVVVAEQHLAREQAGACGFEWPVELFPRLLRLGEQRRAGRGVRV